MREWGREGKEGEIRGEMSRGERKEKRVKRIGGEKRELPPPPPHPFPPPPLRTPLVLLAASF